MEKLKQLVQDLRNIEQIMLDELFDISKASKAELVQTNRDEIFSGKRVDGTDIRPFYRPRTIREKIRKGQPTNRVTLKDTGAMYESMLAKVNSKGFDVDATDSKVKSLTMKYQKFLGISVETFEKKLQDGYIVKLTGRFKKRIEDRY